MTATSRSTGRRDSGRAGWLLGLIFVGLAAGIVAAGNFYYRNYVKHYRAEVELQLSAIADLKVGEVVQWRKERLADGAVFFKNGSFSDFVRRFFENPEDAQAQQQIKSWVEKYQTTNQYDHIRLLDTQGVTRLSVPAGLPAVSFSVAKNVSEVLRSGQVTFQDFYRSDNGQDVYLAVLVPILNESDASRPLGVMILRIDPKAYLYPFIQRWPTPSPTAETLLVRREGNEVVYLNELRFQTPTALTLRRPLDQAALPAARAALRQEGVVEGLDYRGVPVVAALRVIPDSPWSLVARMDLAEVLAPLREQLRLVVVLIGALLLGAGAGIALLWRQQSVRFYRERAAATETIRETNEYLENLFNYANAPIVVWDLQFKITRFNHAFESLTGRKAGEVFGQSLEILFPRALVDSSMALIKKTTGGERWETVEISIVHRDGSFRTVLWNSATVFAADGKNPVATIAQGHDITEHKQAEVTLRESEKRFRSLAVATSQIIWSTDAQGQVCGPMPSFQAYTGQSDEEIRGSGWASTVHPDDIARTIKVWQEAVAAKTGYLTEYRLRRRDGVYRHFTARGAPVVTDDGRILEWIGTCSDITERKQAEEKLRESEARFRKVFEMAPLPLCHVTKAGVIAFRNERFVRVFGYTADEVPTLAEWWLRAYPDPHYRQWVTETWGAAVRRAAAEGRDIDPVEYKVACKSGDERVVEISGITLGEEFLATFIDLTERKRMEEALNAQKQRLEKASAAGNVALWDWDLISGVLEWSSAVDPMLGFGKDKFPRTIRAWGEALHPDDAARVTEALNRHHRGEASYEIDYRVRRTDGSYIWWHVIGVAERDAAGKAVRMTGSCVDITERKQVEEALRESESRFRQLNAELEQRVRDRTAELEAANQELEAFSYSVSHDLRAPLRGIDGFSRILLEKYSAQLDDEGKDSLQRVRAATQRMGELIDDLLTLSRATRAELRRTAVDLTALAGEIVAELERAEPTRRVRWVIAPGLAATGDRQLLRVVLDNLLNNAWKFTSRQAEARIEFGAMKGEQGCAFFVRDNGVGFDMAYAGKLFGAFQRLHATADFPGTGIGLATVQRIIHRHGGRVWAEGEVNHGATFYFTLPATSQQP